MRECRKIAPPARPARSHSHNALPINQRVLPWTPKRIVFAALNDELRDTLTGGTAVMTPGVAARGARSRRPHFQDHHCL